MCQARPLRAPRASRHFDTDEMRIRTKMTVMDKSKTGLGWLLSTIVDCARMGSSSVRNRRSARTGRRPRKLDHCSSMCLPMSIDTDMAAIARSARQPSFWCGYKAHPYQNEGYG